MNNEEYADLIDMVKFYEGFRANQYVCAGGAFTIGYGHVIAPNEGYFNQNAEMTEQQATELLVTDLERYQQETLDAIGSPLREKMRHHEIKALISFVFNLGATNFRASTLLKRIKEHTEESMTAAADEFLRWIYANGKIWPGLQKRRKSEAQMFQGKGWRLPLDWQPEPRREKQ